MDDFSWGNTRLITGEKGRQVIVSDEGKFDPASIPHKRWEEYQAELWDAQTQRDDRSEISGFSYGTKSQYPATTEYNYPGSRPMSHADLRYGSRISLAPSDVVARGYNEQMEMADMAGLPSDDAILAEIREILRTADLMTVTKKSIKMELERRFGVPLEAKRTYIGSGEFALWLDWCSIVLTCSISH